MLSLLCLIRVMEALLGFILGYSKFQMENLKHGAEFSYVLENELYCVKPPIERKTSHSLEIGNCVT